MTDSSAATSPKRRGRLADFIRENSEPIVADWVTFAQTRTPAADDMSKLALKDHVVELLAFIADDLETPQSKTEQVRKSRGLDDDSSEFMRSAAEIHAALRLADGFDIDQVVSEYRALRASVVKLWTHAEQERHPTDLEDITRFNEAVDQALAESVAEYTSKVEQSRDLFLGVLGHDLRNPIMAAQMGARMIISGAMANDQGKMISEHIAMAMGRATSILDDLLEVTRSAFNSELPLVPASGDMGALGSQLVEEMRTISGGSRIEITVTGDTRGTWDGPKVGQVFSNLIGNALDYSPRDGVVTVTIADQGDQVVVSVHNQGDPIPLDKQKTIFDSLTRGRHAGSDRAGTTHLGLGLFIARKITVAHGGTLSVESTAERGTTFHAVFPKQNGDHGVSGA
ncbi:sensor histidine kinase [Pelagibacterium montanilacus]|uniref:sensor histidine kinase n=1 Tax=Pelagibacterium montanilacus TaxID=2185280 RepID=UPI000F8DFBDD|nr:sensor histidine kinase [Pelagibacterium montanilacus]